MLPPNSYVIVHEDDGRFTVLPLLTMIGLRSKAEGGQNETDPKVQQLAEGFLAFRKPGASNPNTLPRVFYGDADQARIRGSEIPEGRVGQVDDPAAAHQFRGGTAVRDRDQDAPTRGTWRFNGHAHLGPQWIEPRGGGQFIGIETLAIGHELAAVFFTVPGSRPLGGRWCGECGTHACSEHGCPEQESFHELF
ncbi:hypothetical protein SBV1_2990012 [Verrucomicrobia bacterium]|nr:hypothetical protein SBV1_2990012 [Verrucomicrobiota bacterium]